MRDVYSGPNSMIVKRSLVIAGHKTSVSLEQCFWQAFKEIAVRREMTLGDLAAKIDGERTHANLSSAVRMFVFNELKSTAHTQLQQLTTAAAYVT